MRTSKIQRILFDEIQGPSIQKEKERKELSNNLSLRVEASLCLLF